MFSKSRLLRLFIFIAFMAGVSHITKIIIRTEISHNYPNILKNIQQHLHSIPGVTNDSQITGYVNEIQTISPKNPSKVASDQNHTTYSAQPNKRKENLFSDGGDAANNFFAQLMFGNTFKDVEKTNSQSYSPTVRDYFTDVWKTSLPPTLRGSKEFTASPTKEVDTIYQSDEIGVYGVFNRSMNYAVYSTTTTTTADSKSSLSFIFYLPLTALSWKRIGFNSVVVIIGSYATWKSEPLLSFVFDQLMKLNSVVIFVAPRAEKDIMLSQVMRIYAGNILRSRYASIDDTYLVTSDADSWPIRGENYILPQNKSILSLNSECCAPFKHRQRVYRMLSMSNVGMKIRSWHQLTKDFKESPNSVDAMLTHVVREFGSVALRPVRKGDNIGWFLDQMLISILVAKWHDRHPAEVKYAQRDTGWDRLDRNNWQVGQTIENKIDTHLPAEGYKPQVWDHIVSLVSLMYGKYSRNFKYCQYYYRKFTKIYSEDGFS